MVAELGDRADAGGESVSLVNETKRLAWYAAQPKREGVKMAQQVSVLLLCDLHGGDVEAVETISFGVGNSAYEIDVCAADAKELRSKLTPFIEHARRKTGGAARRPGRRAADRAHTAEIRSWAKEQGYQISERGRIPASVAAEYEQAH
jgi:hypothetical protein